jgi:hypothetical protein
MIVPQPKVEGKGGRAAKRNPRHVPGLQGSFSSATGGPETSEAQNAPAALLESWRGIRKPSDLVDWRPSVYRAGCFGRVVTKISVQSVDASPPYQNAYDECGCSRRNDLSPV